MIIDKYVIYEHLTHNDSRLDCIISLLLELSSTKSAGEFDIALSLIEHCEAPPIPNIFSFKDEKSKGESTTRLVAPQSLPKSIVLIRNISVFDLTWLSGGAVTIKLLYLGLLSEPQSDM